MNSKGQGDNTMWIIVGLIVVVLTILIVFLLSGKIASLGNKVILGFG
ncbi:TPA: hypothetical protein H1012_00070 [archaeon]|nr:hypothetical protein [Candidatus Naiadarchaeales archaeon SRR2090159.bin1288]